MTAHFVLQKPTSFLAKFTNSPKCLGPTDLQVRGIGQRYEVKRFPWNGKKNTTSRPPQKKSGLKKSGSSRPRVLCYFWGWKKKSHRILVIPFSQHGIHELQFTNSKQSANQSKWLFQRAIDCKGDMVHRMIVLDEPSHNDLLVEAAEKHGLPFKNSINPKAWSKLSWKPRPA